MSATTAIILINLFVFVAMAATGWRSLIMFAPSRLIEFGGSSGIETIAQMQLWRLATSAFVHGGALHLGINMFVLSKIGPEIEQQFGAARFVAIYAVAAICGALGSVWFHPLTVDAGASAAVFGIFGALLAIVWRRPERFPPAYLTLHLKVLIGLVVYSIAFSYIDPTMDHLAHAAGLTAGFLAGLALLPDTSNQLMRASCLLSTLLALIASAALLLPRSGAMYFARAALKHDEGNDKEAVAILTKAIECNPEIAVAYNNRAWSEAALAQYTSALADANKSIQLDPKAATTYDTRAVVFILLGDRERAVADLDKAIALKPDDGAFYYHRAVAKQQRNDETFRSDAGQAAKLKYERERWEPKLLN